MWTTEGEYAELATPLALLFSTRAMPKLRPAIAAGPGELVTAALQPPGRKLYLVLDASGSMLEAVDGQSKFEIAREAWTKQREAMAAAARAVGGTARHDPAMPRSLSPNLMHLPIPRRRK